MNPNTNDHVTAAAAVGRLSSMGASGTETLSDTLQAAATPAASAEMQTTVSAAINADSNYGSLVEKSGDVAKGGFVGGKYQGNFHKLTTAQVQGLSDSAMERYADQIEALKRKPAHTLTSDEVGHIQGAKDHFASINAKPGGYLGAIPDAKSAKNFARLR